MGDVKAPLLNYNVSFRSTMIKSTGKLLLPKLGVFPREVVLVISSVSQIPV